MKKFNCTKKALAAIVAAGVEVHRDEVHRDGDTVKIPNSTGWLSRDLESVPDIIIYPGDAYDYSLVAHKSESVGIGLVSDAAANMAAASWK